MILLAVTLLLVGAAGVLMLLYILLSAVAAGERRAAIARMRKVEQRKAEERAKANRWAKFRYVPTHYTGSPDEHHFTRPYPLLPPPDPSSPPQASKQTPQS